MLIVSIIKIMSLETELSDEGDEVYHYSYGQYYQHYQNYSHDQNYSFKKNNSNKKESKRKSKNRSVQIVQNH